MSAFYLPNRNRLRGASLLELLLVLSCCSVLVAFALPERHSSTAESWRHFCNHVVRITRMARLSALIHQRSSSLSIRHEGPLQPALAVKSPTFNIILPLPRNYERVTLRGGAPHTQSEPKLEFMSDFLATPGTLTIDGPAATCTIRISLRGRVGGRIS